MQVDEVSELEELDDTQGTQASYMICRYEWWSNVKKVGEMCPDRTIV